MQSTPLGDKPRGARDRDHGIVGNQHHIDAARKQRGIDGEPFEQVFGRDRGPQEFSSVGEPRPRADAPAPTRYFSRW